MFCPNGQYSIFYFSLELGGELVSGVNVAVSDCTNYYVCEILKKTNKACDCTHMLVSVSELTSCFHGVH